MQFTPQQLTGGPRYGQHTKIGNWSEDVEIKELKIKDYLKKKSQGGLLVNERQGKLEAALMAKDLAKASSDGLEFGSAVMMINHKSEGFLSTNPYEEILKDGETARPLTTSQNATPCVRNVFTIERARTNDGFGDSNKVHYGQDFVLRCDAFASMGTDSYMMSEHITPLAASKFTRKQEVTLFPVKGGKCLFQFIWPDVKQRFETDGLVVRHDSPVCMKHVHTGRFIASDKVAYQNVFGTEFEVHGHNYVSSNKTQNLTSERSGAITGDYQLRRQGIENLWSVVVDDRALVEEKAGGGEDAAAAEGAEGA